jgi:lipid-A-disaccharide synthase
MPSLFISCADPSADAYAAELARRLKQAQPGLAIWGLGGPATAATGAVDCIQPNPAFGIMGHWEVIKRFSSLRRLIRRIGERFRTQPPAAALLMDSPGLNLRLAAMLKKQNVPVYYLVAPQYWAGRRKGAERLGTLVKTLFVLFPFEEKWFRQRGVNAVWVGHLRISGEQRAASSGPEGDAHRPLLGHFPGSRPQEIAAHLPLMLRAWQQWQKLHPEWDLRISRAPQVKDHPAFRSLPAEIISDDFPGLLSSCGFAWVASGTATLEAAWAGVPQVIIHQAGLLNYLIGRGWYGVTAVGMPNILAGHSLVPECAGWRVSPEQIVRETELFQAEPGRVVEYRDFCRRLEENLRNPRGYEIIAAEILRELK